MNPFWPLDSGGRLDTTRFFGLYTTARNQGLGRISAFRFAIRIKVDER